MAFKGQVEKGGPIELCHVEGGRGWEEEGDEGENEDVHFYF